MGELEIIYENNDLVALEKPAGISVHGKNIGDQEGTVAGWLAEKYPEMRRVGDEPLLRPGIVHRLDKETSGVMLAAKNQASFQYLKSLFQARKIKKTYLALIFGEPKEPRGVISLPIGIRSGTLKRSVRSSKMAKEAVTEYKTLSILEGKGGKKYSLLEVLPKTGRTHQIRVHLAAIGHPVLGDKLYAPKKASSAPRLMLHAFSLEFSPQSGKLLRIEAAPPEDFIKTINILAGTHLSTRFFEPNRS